MGAKSVFDKYECSGQFNLFDYIEQDNECFCWDDDINEIVKRLKDIADAYDLEVGKEEFRVWDHVPHLGYRLWLDVLVTRTELNQESFQSDIEELVDFAKSRNVDLTPMWGACMFFSKDENEKGRLHFTTMFTDKQRQRRK